jgi:hypothetical protein
MGIISGERSHFHTVQVAIVITIIVITTYYHHRIAIITSLLFDDEKLNLSMKE